MSVTPSNGRISGTGSSLSVTVTPTVAAAGSITGPSTVCANETGVAYSIASVAGATTYTWTVPAGATITAGQGTTSITVSFGATSGTVAVTPSNGCFSGTGSSLSVTVTPTVAAAGSITGPSTVCANVTGVAYSIASVAGAT